MVADAVLDADAGAVERYRRDGAVCLRGVIPAHWLDRLRSAAAELEASPGPMAERVGGPASEYFTDLEMACRLRSFAEFARDGPCAALAGALMGSQRVCFFYDQYFQQTWRAPGGSQQAAASQIGVSRRRTPHTPWHQDQPYWHVTGNHYSHHPDHVHLLLKKARGLHLTRPAEQVRKCRRCGFPSTRNLPAPRFTTLQAPTRGVSTARSTLPRGNSIRARANRRSQTLTRDSATARCNPCPGMCSPEMPSFFLPWPCTGKWRQTRRTTCNAAPAVQEETRVMRAWMEAEEAGEEQVQRRQGRTGSSAAWPCGSRATTRGTRSGAERQKMSFRANFSRALLRPATPSSVSASLSSGRDIIKTGSFSCRCWCAALKNKVYKAAQKHAADVREAVGQSAFLPLFPVGSIVVVP